MSWPYYLKFNPFLANVFILYPLLTTENLSFFKKKNFAGGTKWKHLGEMD